MSRIVTETDHELQCPLAAEYPAPDAACTCAEIRQQQAEWEAAIRRDR
jgi:hypothetical protein